MFIDLELNKCRKGSYMYAYVVYIWLVCCVAFSVTVDAEKGFADMTIHILLNDFDTDACF